MYAMHIIILTYYIRQIMTQQYDTINNNLVLSCTKVGLVHSLKPIHNSVTVGKIINYDYQQSREITTFIQSQAVGLSLPHLPLSHTNKISAQLNSNVEKATTGQVSTMT